MGFGINEVAVSTTVITNDGFFPDIKVADFQNVFHEVTEVDFEKVIFTLRSSILKVNRQLKTVKANTTESSLVESDNEKLGDVSGLEIEYQSAVFGTAKTELLPLIINIVSREKANDIEANINALKREYKTQSNQAIRSLLGLGSSTVEVI